MITIGLNCIKSFKNMVWIKIQQYYSLHWVGDIRRKPCENVPKMTFQTFLVLAQNFTALWSPITSNAAWVFEWHAVLRNPECLCINVCAVMKSLAKVLSPSAMEWKRWIEQCAGYKLMETPRRTILIAIGSVLTKTLDEWCSLGQQMKRGNQGTWLIELHVCRIHLYARHHLSFKSFVSAGLL